MSETYTIGRRQTCDIVLTEPSVSRHHAELVLEEGRATLFDKNSRYGTFVKEEGNAEWRRVASVLLTGSERVRFGRHEMPARDLLGVSASRRAGPALGQAPVERNPETGEIIARRR